MTTGKQKVTVTPEQIAEWKAKYGENKVKQIDLPLDDEGKEYLTVYGIVPTRRILSEWEKWSDKNPDRAKEILVKNCLLTEVDRVLNDQDLFFSAIGAVTELIPVRRAITKNC